MKIINNKKEAIQELKRISNRTNSENNYKITAIVEEILQEVKNNGDIAVALTNENEATLKRFRKRGDTIALEPANELFETRIYSAGQINIQGILIGLIRRY